MLAVAIVVLPASERPVFVEQPPNSVAIRIEIVPLGQCAALKPLTMGKVTLRYDRYGRSLGAKLQNAAMAPRLLAIPDG